MSTACASSAEASSTRSEGEAPGLPHNLTIYYLGGCQMAKSHNHPTFTVVSKRIGEIVEVSYNTQAYASLEELEDDLKARGEQGTISYYLYGSKGTKRKEPGLRAWLFA